MATIKIKQVKSRIKCPKDQKRTLDALGLTKLNRVVEHEATPAILGMVALCLASFVQSHYKELQRHYTQNKVSEDFWHAS